MSRPRLSKYPLFFRVASCLLLTISFFACSKGAQQSGGPGAPASGTGGVSFRLVWQGPPVSRAKAQFSPQFNACVDHAIGAISATVSDAATTVASDSWPCSEHEGLILGVPPGTNFTLQVNGISSGSTTTTWSGSLASAITVTANQITDAGTIVMAYIGVDNTPPTVTSITPASTPTTTNVPVTDRIIIAFSETMAMSTINAAGITLNSSGSSTVSVSGIVSYVTASNAAAFIPSANLDHDKPYVLQIISCITVTSCITDIAGNPLASDYTNTFTTESARNGAPDAPSQIKATPGNGQVTLDWLASNGSASYNIYYLSSADTTTTLIPDVRAPYVHIGLTNTLLYTYLVSAINGTYETKAADTVSATPIYSASTTSVPSPPVSLTVTSGIRQNDITWSAVDDATSYNLYWSTTPITDKTSADNVIRNIPSNIGQRTHTDLTKGLIYYYIVTAMNPYGESAESMQAAAAPQ